MFKILLFSFKWRIPRRSGSDNARLKSRLNHVKIAVVGEEWKGSVIPPRLNYSEQSHKYSKQISIPRIALRFDFYLPKTPDDGGYRSERSAAAISAFILYRSFPHTKIAQHVLFQNRKNWSSLKISVHARRSSPLPWHGSQLFLPGLSMNPQNYSWNNLSFIRASPYMHGNNGCCARRCKSYGLCEPPRALLQASAINRPHARIACRLLAPADALSSPTRKVLE